MEERLEILRAHRPGGWRPRLALEGREHLDAALTAGARRGALDVALLYADLVTKMALHDAGYPVSHLSAFSRGFSPNSCWSWTRSRFGMKVLSPLRTRIEDRYLRERVVMPLDGGLRWMRTLTERLRAGGLVSIRAGDVGERALELPFLASALRLATGPRAWRSPPARRCFRSAASGADRATSWSQSRPPLRAPPARAAATRPTTWYGRSRHGSKAWVLRQPHLWSGWYQMATAHALVEGRVLPGDAAGRPAILAAVCRLLAERLRLTPAHAARRVDRTPRTGHRARLGRGAAARERDRGALRPHDRRRRARSASILRRSGRS